MATIIAPIMTTFDAAFGLATYVSAILSAQISFVDGLQNRATMADEVVRIAAAYSVLKEKLQKNKRLWIRPYLNRRVTLDNISLEICLDNNLFTNFSRMSKCDFEFLLNKIGAKIKRNEISSICYHKIDDNSTVFSN